MINFARGYSRALTRRFSSLRRIKRFFIVHLWGVVVRAIGTVAPNFAKQLTSCEDVFFNKPNRFFAVSTVFHCIVDTGI